MTNVPQTKKWRPRIPAKQPKPPIWTCYSDVLPEQLPTIRWVFGLSSPFFFVPAVRFCSHLVLFSRFVILKSQRKMGSSKWLPSIYFGVLYFFFSGKIRYIQTFN